MKALIFGNRGWIGNMMSKLLNNSNIEFVSASSRANNKHDVEAEIHGTHEGKEFTTIDFLEQKGRIVDNVRDNLFSPMVLAMLCKKHNIHFTYLGTGCIFKYDDDHPMGNESIGFTEESLPNFFGSGYSVVKGYTDELMHLFEDNVITDKLEPRNFITKITTYEYICSIPNAMTVLDELLPYALDMARKGITGTINLTNPGLVSHNEILEMYREIVDPSFTWKNFSQEEQAKILAADRSNNCLDTSKLKEIFPEVKHIKDSVRETLERMKNRL
jgi:3,5-epimerase/4-reductase